MPPDTPQSVETLVEPLAERLFHFTDISGTHKMYITRSDASCSEVMKRSIDSGMIVLHLSPKEFSSLHNWLRTGAIPQESIPSLLNIASSLKITRLRDAACNKLELLALRNEKVPPEHRSFSAFEQYCLASANLDPIIAAGGREAVVSEFDKFIEGHIEALVKGWHHESQDVGRFVADLARTWKQHQPPLVITSPPPPPPTIPTPPTPAPPLLHEGWNPLPEVVASSMTAIFTEPHRVDFFAHDKPNSLMTRWGWYEESARCCDKQESRDCISKPAVIRYNSNMLDIYFQNGQGECKEKIFNLSSLGYCPEYTPPLQPRKISSAPTAICTKEGRTQDCLIDVFAIGEQNDCIHNWWKDGRWQGWKSLGGNMMPQIVTVAGDSKRLHVFALGTDHRLYHNQGDGSQWAPKWDCIGGPFSSGLRLTATTSGQNGIDLLLLDDAHLILHTSYNGKDWSGWERLGVSLSVPLVYRSSSERLDVFMVGADNQCWHAIRNGNISWSPWESLGGSFVSLVSAVDRSSHRIMLFGIGADSVCWRKVYQV